MRMRVFLSIIPADFRHASQVDRSTAGRLDRRCGLNHKAARFQRGGAGAQGIKIALQIVVVHGSLVNFWGCGMREFTLRLPHRCGDGLRSLAAQRPSRGRGSLDNGRVDAQ